MYFVSVHCWIQFYWLPLLLDKEFLGCFICLHVYWRVTVQQLPALPLAKVRVQAELDRDPLLTPTEQTAS